MKKCNLDCVIQHEGYCSWDLKECKAIKDSDLLTEEEYESELKMKGN